MDEDIMLSEISQTQKDKYVYLNTHIYIHNWHNAALTEGTRFIFVSVFQTDTTIHSA